MTKITGIKTEPRPSTLSTEIAGENADNMLLPMLMS